MPTLSHSQIETWEQCPARWRLTKLDRIPEAPSEHLALGTAVHVAIEQDMRRRARGVRHSAGQTGLELLDGFIHALRDDLAARDPHHLLSHAVRETVRRRGRAILAAYAYGAAPRLYPMPGAVEESFTVAVPDLPGWQFTGRMDARTRVADRAPVIVDFKTAGKPWPVGAEHTKQQAAAYLWADGQTRRREHAASVAFVTLPDTAAGDGSVRAAVDIRVTRRTPDQLAGYAAHVAEVARNIERAKASGDFPARTGPLCGWCGVAYRCADGRAWLAAHGRQMQPAITAMATAATVEQTA